VSWYVSDLIFTAPGDELTINVFVKILQRKIAIGVFRAAKARRIPADKPSESACESAPDSDVREPECIRQDDTSSAETNCADKPRESACECAPNPDLREPECIEQDDTSSAETSCADESDSEACARKMAKREKRRRVARVRDCIVFTYLRALQNSLTLFDLTCDSQMVRRVANLKLAAIAQEAKRLEEYKSNLELFFVRMETKPPRESKTIDTVRSPFS
jgi:hypothetical protein